MRVALFGVAAIALLAAFWWWGARPRLYRNVPLDGFHRFVRSLLVQMAPGGFLVADRQNGAGFLQLALRSASADSYTVEFGLPDVDWSTSRFNGVRAALANRGFEVSVEPGTGNVHRFMRVRVVGTSDGVIGRVTTLFQQVSGALGWGDSPLFTVRFGGSLDVPRIRTRLAAIRGRGA